jgi:hypothetical protein
MPDHTAPLNHRTFCQLRRGCPPDRLVGIRRNEKKALYGLAAELEERVTVEEVEGPYFDCCRLVGL